MFCAYFAVNQTIETTLFDVFLNIDIVNPESCLKCIHFDLTSQFLLCMQENRLFLAPANSQVDWKTSNVQLKGRLQQCVIVDNCILLLCEKDCKIFLQLLEIEKMSEENWPIKQWIELENNDKKIIQMEKK